MSNTLIIHPYDPTTVMLDLVYEGVDADVITDCNMSREELRRAIAAHDRIIMLGHGTGAGLLNPRNYTYLIDESFVDLLKTKETISVWCFSDVFFRKHNIPGFHTGMIISEVMEERFVLGYAPLDEQEIFENMNEFSRVIHDCLDMSPQDMKDYVLAHYVGDDAVTQFNRSNIKVL